MAAFRRSVLYSSARHHRSDQFDKLKFLRKIEGAAGDNAPIGLVLDQTRCFTCSTSYSRRAQDLAPTSLTKVRLRLLLRGWKMQRLGLNKKRRAASVSAGPRGKAVTLRRRPAAMIHEYRLQGRRRTLRLRQRHGVGMGAPWYRSHPHSKPYRHRR